MSFEPESLFKCTNTPTTSTSDDFAFAELLDLIEEGQIVMLSDFKAFESEEEWAIQQLELSLLYRVEIVEHCINAVASRNNVTLTEINEEINEEIVVNMQQLEIFPPFVEKFRRFVILAGDDDQLEVSMEGVSLWPVTMLFLYTYQYKCSSNAFLYRSRCRCEPEQGYY